jgi:hypothetical protein
MIKFVGQNIFKVYPEAKYAEDVEENRLYIVSDNVSVTTDKKDNIIEVVDFNSLGNTIEIDELTDEEEYD